ncbi:MAG: DinB family protein [Acidobacteriota bacterium]|nr:DinB family protein [Acidobacteriota bacterium]
MLTHILHAYDLQLSLAKRLVNDIPEDRMCEQPNGLVNHPMWSLGHLVMSANSVGKMIGIEPSAPEGWGELFKTGGTPSGDRAGFPSKDDVVTAFEKVHESWKAALPGVDASVLNAEHPDENTRAYFPTVGAMVMFIMTSHEMDHLGQVTAWRRAAGLGPAQ